MGSNITSVGNAAGKSLYTFTAAGQDTGPLLFNEASRWSKWLFQLIGSGLNFAITVYGTIDVNTAAGTANEWFELPAPSTEASASWSNPLQPGASTNALFCNAPLVAVRAVSAGNINGSPSGSVSLLALVLQ